MKNKKTSPLNDEKKLSKVVENSNNYSECLKKFNLSIAGGNVRTLKKYLLLFNISIKHFYKFKQINKITYKMEDVFCIDSKYDTKFIKKRIIKFQLIPYHCSCGIKNIWNDKELTLQLEHKNGNNTDNRLTNLEFLCPNCHSQTHTYGSKNIKLRKKENDIFMYKNAVERVFLEKDNLYILEKNIEKYKNYKEILDDFKIRKSSNNVRALKDFLK